MQLVVNGQPHQCEPAPGATLLDLLRDSLGLLGAKRGCDRGECGACTVLVDGKPVYGCLTPAVRLGDHTIVTIEGLASDGGLHPIQKAFAEEDALQCGFCTPG